MIEVEKNTSISQTIPLEPLILMSKNELVGIPDLSHFLSNDIQISGVIPSEIGNLYALGELNLSNNQLSGGIPSELGDLSGLK